MNRLAQALEMTEQPVKALFVFCSNPVVVAPEADRVRAGMQREDLFTVVHELFMTDTAKYADIVLPSTASFENTDLYASYWHHYMQLQEPVLRHRESAKATLSCFRCWAGRWGLTRRPSVRARTK